MTLSSNGSLYEGDGVVYGSFGNAWNSGYGMRIDPDELELRGIRSFIRRRYDENKEFVPAEEVYEIVLSYCKWYRAENKRLMKVIEDYSKFYIPPTMYIKDIK